MHTLLYSSNCTTHGYFISMHCGMILRVTKASLIELVPSVQRASPAITKSNVVKFRYTGRNPHSTTPISNLSCLQKLHKYRTAKCSGAPCQRFYSDNKNPTGPPAVDELSDLLGQLSVTKESTEFQGMQDMGLDSDLTDIFSEEASQTSLPGHRIRGILVPTKQTHSAIVGSQRYSELPIAHVQASYQNTIVSITNSAGMIITDSSGGKVGFKNAKKRTAIAAQAAGLLAGQAAVRRGLTHVRVAIKGLGKGRLAACKGLEEAGLTVVSLTDVTRVDFGTQTPRKKRRL